MMEKSQQGISKIKLKWDLTSEFFVFFVSWDLWKLTTISIAFRATGRQFEFLGHNSTTWLLLCMTTIKTYGGKRRILPNNTPTHLFFAEIHRNRQRWDCAVDTNFSCFPPSVSHRKRRSLLIKCTILFVQNSCSPLSYRASRECK